MLAVLQPMLAAMAQTLRTGGRVIRNRLSPFDGIDLMVRLDIVGREGLARTDLGDLGPEGIVTACRWLHAMVDGGLAERIGAATPDERYVLTLRGRQALAAMAQGTPPRR